MKILGIIASLCLRYTLRKLENDGKMYNPVKKSKAWIKVCSKV